MIFKIWDFTECMFNALLTHCKKIRILFFFATEKFELGWNDPDGMRVPFVQDKCSIQGANIIEYWFEDNPELDSFSLAG